MADTLHVEVDGGAGFRAHLARHREALDAGTQRGVTLAARQYGRGIRDNLRRRTHPIGTPTNSPPGEPPALVTGHLNRSVKDRAARRIRAHVFEASSGPTAVYARIHERSGWTGRGHATFLPARPYVHPAFRTETPRAREIIRREIRAAVRRVR